MRFVYIALIVLITGLVLVFALQNVEAVTVRFLTVSLTLPRAVLLIGVYLLGMLTGGLVVGFVKSLVQGARLQQPGAQSGG
ncbi:MAG: LapA family protein [Thioalkalivibrio sp.]|nr:MAG: LapA family protein [Thioalkalivibrio sp.]